MRWMPAVTLPAQGTLLRSWHSFLGADAESEHLLRCLWGPRRSWSRAQLCSLGKKTTDTGQVEPAELKRSRPLRSLRGND